ncbi:MAG TPA: choice-of-anchor Q domain-containing protein [Verrucomicrobiae bacterium]|nr:choice-of-anchor Q domain-containing protein [Verrucomicrobiae bacterium]
MSCFPVPQIISLFALWGYCAFGEVRYVNVNSASPVTPFTSWATAARVIQDAIEVSAAGDLILVTNGVYQTGGLAVFASQTNRVALTKALTVQSINGPDVTIIRGYQLPGVTNGDGAVRCAYLTNGAALIGFTLTNGATFGLGYYFDYQSGGGAYLYPGGTLSNCILAGNVAYGDGGGARSGTLVNCSLIGNRAFVDGGAALWSTLSNCYLFNNRADSNGGGVYSGSLDNCTVISNYAGANGGGASDSTLRNCNLVRNSASAGGGVAGGTIINSTVVSNSAATGGGASGSFVTNCVLPWNTATTGGGASFCNVKNSSILGNTAAMGGGSYSGSLENTLVISNRANQGGGANQNVMRNCTIVFNEADQGGGLYFGRMYNSICYYNTSTNGENYQQGAGDVGNRNCVKPLPAVGTGNFTNAPLFQNETAGDFRLQPMSPCINAGRNADAPEGPDLSANSRIAGGTVDLGAYEFQTPTSLISYAWLQQYGLPSDGSVDYLDGDGDGHNSWQEWRAGTVPTNSQSVLRLLPPLRVSPGLSVKWQSVTGKLYWIERSTNLLLISPLVTRGTNLFATSNSVTFNDVTATNLGPYYYRVEFNSSERPSSTDSAPSLSAR